MRTIKVLHGVFITFPDMGEIKVISIVLQLLKTISDRDLLASLMLHAGWLSQNLYPVYYVISPQSMTLFSLSIPPTTGCHSVNHYTECFKENCRP